MQTATLALQPLETRWQSSLQNELSPGAAKLTFGELLLAVRAATATAKRDALVRPSLEAARAGCERSQHFLLVLMTPKIHKLAHTHRALQGLPYQQALALALTGMWDAITNIKLKATSHHLLTQLGFAAWHHIERASTDQRETTSAGADLRETMTETEATNTPSSVESELITLLRWANETNTLSRDEIILLARTHTSDKAERHALAAELNIDPQSLNRRVARLRTRLKKAVQAHISEHGAW